MSRQMKDARSKMEEQMEDNEQLRVLMASLRGSNLSDADFADAAVQVAMLRAFFPSHSTHGRLPLRRPHLLSATLPPSAPTCCQQGAAADHFLGPSMGSSAACLDSVP